MSTDRQTSILSLNAFAPGDAEGLPDDLKAMVERRKKSFGPSSILFYRSPIHVASATGARITATDGREYLDFYNNVPSVGHCHPKVAEAVYRQMKEANSHSRYLYDIVETYAERLLATMPEPIAHVTFTCTGSEANDLALRMARMATGAHGIVVTRGAYHGNTTAVTEISPSSYKRGGPPAFVKLVEPPSEAAYGKDIATGFERAVAAAVAELKAEGHGFAAFVADTIFSSDGVFTDPAGFLKPTIDTVHREGGLFVADEVQPGFGRTGTHMWGFDRHGVAPDLATTGKPMGNGFPLGGVFSKPGLLEGLQENFGYFNTFGGTPAAAAAGLAVLDVIAEEELMARAVNTGALLKERLTALGGKYATIADVRGAGLYLGVTIADTKAGSGANADPTSRIVNAMKEKGVLIGVAGLGADVLKIRPPLAAGEAEAEAFADRLETVLSELGLD